MCNPYPPQDEQPRPRFRSPDDDWALPMTAMEQDMEDNRPREDPDAWAWPEWE